MDRSIAFVNPYTLRNGYGLAPFLYSIRMDRQLLTTLETFLHPYYQDVDGAATRFEEVDRVGRIARRLYMAPTADAERSFELLLLFHRLGFWLEKVGNLSRAML